MLTKGKDEIPSGLYILRFHGENAFNRIGKPYERKVKVSKKQEIDEKEDQWVSFENAWIYKMSDITDKTTFEPTEFDEAILEFSLEPKGCKDD